MKTNTLILFDEDEMYVRFLDGYVRGAIKLPLRVQEVTKKEHFEKALAFSENDAGSRNLVISEALYKETDEKALRGMNVLVLKEDGPSFTAKEGEAPYTQNRYRPAQEIAEAIRVMMSGDEMTVCGAGTLRAASDTLIGFYTPVKRSFQTTLALTMGQLLSERYKVLYLTFEAFPGMYFSEGAGAGNLTDLLYYYDCAREKLPLYVEKFQENINGLSCIRPANCASEIREADYGTWQGLLETLSMSGAYDKILLDLTDLVDGVTGLLEGCGSVFLTATHGIQEEQKVRQYLHSLRAEGAQALCERTKQLLLPVTSVPKIQGLKTSEIATYIRKAGLIQV